jgi:hypothetical protein
LYAVGLLVDGTGLNFILLVFRLQEPSRAPAGQATSCSVTLLAMAVVAKLFSILSFIFFLSKLLVPRLIEVVNNIHDEQEYN